MVVWESSNSLENSLVCFKDLLFGEWFHGYTFGLVDGSFAYFFPSVADWMEFLKEGDVFLKDRWKQGLRISIMKHDFLESRLGELFVSVMWKVCL